MVIPRPGNPHVITGDTLPITLCHEFCGRIAESTPAGIKGAGGKPLRPGMPVMVDPRLNCRSCSICTDLKSSNICESWGFRGLSGGGGGFAEQCAVNADYVYALPDNIDLRNVALIEPLAVGRRALTQSGVSAGDWSTKSILVLGGGPIGIALMHNLRAYGATKILLSEPTALRQEQCSAIADQVLNPAKVKVPEECRRLTEGTGVDIVFDCAGVGPAMRDGMDALRRQGTYMNVAGWETPFEIPMQHAMLKEIVIRMIMAYDEGDFAETVADFVSGQCDNETMTEGCI
jgi:threonine dehydrogenase-like Zn-dependent dehydrogenase